MFARVRALGLVGFVAPAVIALCCGSPAQTEPPCPDSTKERLQVGDWDGERLLELENPATLVYGSQGGQHVFIDARLQTKCPDEFTVFLDFAEDATGNVVGLGESPARTRSCSSLLEDVRLFLEDDEERRGVLSVYAEGDEGCRIEAEDIELSIVRPF